MRRAALLVVLAGCPSSSASSSSAVPADASTSSPPPQANDAGNGCAIDAQGALLDTMSAIVAAMRAGGGKGSNALQVPSAADRDAFAASVVDVLSGDESAACTFPASYRLVHLVDPNAGALRVIAEVDATGKPAPTLYWGTYVAPRVTPSRALAIEAPHPIFDTNTELQSTALFVESGAAYLMVAGAHRCADDAASACSGTTDACGTTAPFRISDAAHTDALPFFAVLALLSQSSPSLVFIQLHGNAEACPDALMSDGSGAWSDTGPTGVLAGELASRGVAIGKCGSGYPTSACNLCGTDNVEARFTAGSPAACTQIGTTYGRLVHIEQQSGLRATPSAGAPGYQPLIDAVNAAFPAK
jgi:hypothetical protein